MSARCCPLHDHVCPLGDVSVCTHRSACIANWLQYPIDRWDWAGVQRFLAVLSCEGGLPVEGPLGSSVGGRGGLSGGPCVW